MKTSPLPIILLITIAETFVMPPFSERTNKSMVWNSLLTKVPSKVSAKVKNKEFPIAAHTFKSYVTDASKYFVDKSMWIQKVVGKLNYFHITRPRRFGKSTNLSMLREFLDKNTNSTQLFTGLRISHESEFCSEHQNKYLVIYMDFKRFKSDDYETLERLVVERLKGILMDIVDDHRELLSPNRLRMFELNIRDKEYLTAFSLCNEFASIFKELTRRGVRYGILIDDYDFPFLQAHQKDTSPKKLEGEFLNSGYYKKTYSLFRQVLLTFFKSILVQPNVGVIVGTSIVDEETIMSGLNNLEISSVLNTRNFGSDFGFTKSDVENLLRESHSSVKYELLKNFYGGYSYIEGGTIFHPCSVMNALRSSKLDVYWSQTGAVSVVDSLLEKSGAKGMLDMRNLITKKPLEKRLYEKLAYSTIGTKKETYWSLLAHAGYINVERGLLPMNLYHISLPNEELRRYLEARVPHVRTVTEFH